MKQYYYIEQINVSDTDYKLTGLNKKDGDNVVPGDILFSYESSKVDFEVESIAKGYVYYNEDVEISSSLQIGSLVSVVVDHKLIDIGDKKSFFEAESVSINKDDESITEQVITKKARILIDKYKIESKLFSEYSIVNEDVINEIISKVFLANTTYQSLDFYYSSNQRRYFQNRLKRLAIIGAGKASLQLYDAIISEKKYIAVCLYDDNEDFVGKSLMDIPIVGNIDYKKIKEDYINGNFEEIIISFSGDIKSRENIFRELVKLDIPFANVIHPSALLSNFVTIGTGNIIFANVRIGPFVEVGDNNVLSAYCSIEHHTLLGSHNSFGPAVITSGSCVILNGNRFGTGIFLEPRVKVSDNCLISSGVVLRQNIKSNSIVKNQNKIEVKDKNEQ